MACVCDRSVASHSNTDVMKSVTKSVAWLLVVTCHLCVHWPLANSELETFEH